MACDIHAFAERKDGAGNWTDIKGYIPFAVRNYRLFGFLAGVRSYAVREPIAPNRGLPGDISVAVAQQYAEWDDDSHNNSWVSMAELLAVDYDVVLPDVFADSNEDDESATAEPEGPLTLREFLGAWFFDDLAMLQSLGAERIVFWFDN